MNPFYYTTGEPVLVDDEEAEVLWSDSNGYLLSFDDDRDAKYYEYYELQPVDNYEYEGAE